MNQFVNKIANIADKAKWILMPVAIIGSPFFGNFLAKAFFRGSEDLLEILCFLIAAIGCWVVLDMHYNKVFKDQYVKSDGDNGVDAYPTFIDVGGFTDSGSGGF